MTKLDPKAVASQHIHIFRCLGNLARGNLVNCHLINAGVDEWRADCVLALYNTQIQIVWNDVKDDSHFSKEARAIIERCAEQAGVKLDPC